jgi:hypothetical protein
MNRPPSARDPMREPLSEALRRAADDLARHQPPAAVHAAVRARLAPRGQTAGQLAVVGFAGRRSASWAPWTTAVLCGALLIASTALLLQPGAGAGRPVAAAGWAADTALLGFLPTASAGHWLREAGAAPAWVISAELPREQLAEFGLPFDPTRAADTVRAELLLRSNGEVMAVRVLADAPR